MAPETEEPPAITGASQPDSAPVPGIHELWGVWSVSFDPETQEFELVGLREADFHLNITKVLQPPMPGGISLYLNSFDLPSGFIDVDIAITHPFPNSDLRIFDTRLILMGMGNTIISGIDPGLTYPALDGFRLLNADGYSRWWNANEFTTEGFFGFLPSSLGTQPWPGNATLNGYKYFADPLLPTDPVVPKVNTTNRGTFSTTATPPTLRRNFQIRFPIDPDSGKPIWMFQLAVDACWVAPTGGSPPPKPIEDFPPQANSPEAFNIEVTFDGSTAYYDDGDSGGDLVVQIEVFDWQVPSNFNGIDGEVGEIRLESETLFDTIHNVLLNPVQGSQDTSGIYEITIQNVHPTGLENQEIVVMVGSLNPSTFAPPAPAFVYPAGAKLAAYKIVEVPISDTPPVPKKITVLIPNGGEIWQQGTSEEITWSSTGDIGPNVSIGYTILDGPYYPISASSPDDGSYIWDPIPEVESPNIKIFIRSIDNPTVSDKSDEYFTITEIQPPPDIIVTAPNGHEVWVAGGVEEITWVTVGDVSPEVSIGYTISDGPKVEIISSTENDGSFFWDPIADIDSNEVKIVVTDINLTGVEDESDGFFTIEPPGPDPTITVTIPNGGETWVTGTAEEITWTSTGPVGDFVKIEYSISDTTPVEIEFATMNSGSYMWDPIPDDDSDEVRIIISDLTAPAVTDASDNFFTIEPPQPDPELRVTVPNGGEIWVSGTAEEITWDSIGDVGDFVSINFTIADGVPLVVTPNTDNDGSFIWDPIPTFDNNEVRIQIVDNSNPLVRDDSDGYFTIQQAQPDPEIIIIIPNGGEEWTAGGSEEITWTSIGAVGPNVSIFYSISEAIPETIIGPTPNDGSFIWDPIPNVDSDEVKILMIDYDAPIVADQSDNYFTIGPGAPIITVQIPNGGETWEAGTSWEITWTSEGPVGSTVSLFYSISDATPILIIEPYPNDGDFTWDPIPDVDSDEVRVIISDYDEPTVTDQSDGYFTINPAGTPSITVAVPNGGQEWVIGDSEQIEWTSQNVTGDVSISYTLDDAGVPIEIIPSTENDGVFEWTPIPGPDTDTARVIVTSINEPTATDQSDNYFRIWDGIEDTLTLTSPIGGENLHAGDTWEITWDWTGDIINVNLLLSTDSGATYPDTIAPSTECDGSFMWDPIPDIDTDTARIKVEWDIDTDVNDESDADFSIYTGEEKGWLPIDGMTGVQFTTPAPFHDEIEVDLGIWSGGDNQSRCEFVDQNDDDFYTANDDYTATIGDTWSWMLINDSIHKFDVLPDGSWAFVTNSESAAWNDPWVKDPKHCVYSSHEVDGTGFNFVITGDMGDEAGGIEDPDAAAWLQAVDFSCGVPGGIADDRAYMLHVFSPGTPVAHDGRIRLVAWDGPTYGTAGLSAWLFSLSTQGGTTPMVDDSDPLSMALAVDDNTLVHFGDDELVHGFWILDSVGVITTILVRWSDGGYLAITNQLDSEEYGSGTPVDMTIANANAFDYSVSVSGDFNWICILFDNGDGTWSVGIWECDYITEDYHLIDITDPLPGTPMAVDFDGNDFEIHVFANNGGTIEATVFEYVP